MLKYHITSHLFATPYLTFSPSTIYQLFQSPTHPSPKNIPHLHRKRAAIGSYVASFIIIICLCVGEGEEELVKKAIFYVEIAANFVIL